MIASVSVASASPWHARRPRGGGSANVLTAAICTLTNGEPAGVCHSAGVQAAAAQLTH
jgi:hypothetical protein